MAKFAALFLLLSSVCILSRCSFTPVSKRGGFRLCGGRLVETLSMICGGDFYGPDLQARDLREEGDADMFPLWIMGLSPSKTNGFDRNYRLNRRQLMGVVDECCKKQCTFSTLASYCMK